MAPPEPESRPGADGGGAVPAGAEVTPSTAPATSDAPPRFPDVVPFDPTHDAREADWILLVLAVLVLAAAALLEVTPAKDGVTLFGYRVPESCGAKRFFHSSCPGCGLTRSFVLAVHGEPEAFRLHPAGPYLLLVLAAQIPFRLGRLLRARRLRRAGEVDLRALEREHPAWRVLRWSLLVALLAGWLLRVTLGLSA